MKELWELFSVFFKIGGVTFGGGYAMLPMFERELVEKKRWATLEEVMDYFAISQCTPGVIAVNIATFIGYKIKGVLGGIIATLGVVTPSVIIISIIAAFFKLLYQNPIAKHIFAGIGLAVCALLLQALFKVIKTGIKTKFSLVVAVLAFLALFIFNISPILVVVLAGTIGGLWGLKKKNDEQEEKE